MSHSKKHVSFKSPLTSARAEYEDPYEKPYDDEYYGSGPEDEEDGPENGEAGKDSESFWSKHWWKFVIAGVCVVVVAATLTINRKPRLGSPVYVDAPTASISSTQPMRARVSRPINTELELADRIKQALKNTT